MAKAAPVNIRSDARSFIERFAWGRELPAADMQRVVDSVQERTYGRNESLVRAPEPGRFWVGIVRGFVVQSVTHTDGAASFLSAVGDDAWFGEGTLIKRTCWGYDAVALRETSAVLVPLVTFEWLRETSIPFNHFLQVLMNARLRTYIGTILSARHSSTEARVATALTNLLDEGQDPRQTELRLSQSELAMLAGTSRQRVNDALKKLSAQGLVMPRRQGIVILNVERLRAIANLG